MTELDSGEDSSYAPLGWNRKYNHYRCHDRKCIGVPHRSASVRDLDETKIVPRNMITYTASKKELRMCISGIKFSRDMTKVFGGSDDIRTVIFPNMVRTVRQGAFRGVKSLKSVILNERLEVLGTDERSLSPSRYCGVF